MRRLPAGSRDALLGICIAVLGCIGGPSAPAPPKREAIGTRAEGPVVLLAAGDIAYCKNLRGATATAQILGRVDGEIAALGDLAYPNGTAQEFHDCYGTTWGRYKNRTHPALGNHEYHSSGAGPYFDYFGPAAGDPGKGYYSYDLGSWHIVVLNSNCESVGGGCKAGSPQERWLRDDLATHRTACTLAYWHHPLFSSGPDSAHAQSSFMQDIWVDLYGSGADIVLNGHEHKYERFAPQDAAGRPDPNGIREFVVGTGGAPQDGFRLIPLQNSEVRDTGHFGVLRLALGADSYEWEFLGEDSASFHDAGSGKCHGRPGL
jgi:hypothetical protein